MEDLRRIADSRWDAVWAVGCKATETDRYDDYLATAAFMLWNGESETKVGDYLVDVEIERLGIDTGSGIRERAQLFARAIRQYLTGNGAL